MNSEGSSLAKFDQDLVTIFLKELSSQIKTLQQCYEVLCAKPQDPSHLERLIQTLQEMMQAAKIIGLASLVQAGRSLITYMESIREGKQTWDDVGQTALRQMLEFLTDLTLNPPPAFDRFIANKGDVLIAIDRALHQPKQKSAAAIDLPKVVVSKEEPEPIFFDEKMADLFQVELEMQSQVLSQGLIELEQTPNDASLLEKLMRGAHSIKGAARIVALNPIVRLAHAMEDCFVAAQKGKITINEDLIDKLLKGVDVLGRLSRLKLEQISPWTAHTFPEIEGVIKELSNVLSWSPDMESDSHIEVHEKKSLPPPSPPEKTEKKEIAKLLPSTAIHDRVLRITAENLNRLMGLAGESLVESRWLFPFGEGLQRVKTQFKKMDQTINGLMESLRKEKLQGIVQRQLTDLHDQLNSLSHQVTEHLTELDHFIGRFSTLSDRLYQEVVNSRMRPFADGIAAFPRMVRDLARQAGKQVRLEIVGQSTQVDREILEKLESPLSHLLRNAVDHGIERPEERLAAGKKAEGVIRLEARHQGGMLAITVSDDGRGIDTEKVRRKIIEQKYLAPEVADRLSTHEMTDFLFYPVFPPLRGVSEVSGRGVGLNIVQTMVQEVGGTVRISFTPGQGSSFHSAASCNACGHSCLIDGNL